MNSIIINLEELSALSGLPHLQQLLYLRGLRPYVDYQTGLVGIKRGISYQSLREELFIEPHQGISGGSPSKDQIRRALKGLERASVLCIQSEEKKLVVYCNLVTLSFSVQNKPATNPLQKPTLNWQDKVEAGYGAQGSNVNNPAPSNRTKPAIPLKEDNYIIFLSQEFEKFWELYPLKKSKQKAWEQFQHLKLSKDLMTLILKALREQIQFHAQQSSHGIWLPPWKYPANWLSQHCWEDEINVNSMPENNDAVNQTSHSAERDSFWEACRAGTEEELESTDKCNVIAFNQLRKKC